MDAGLYILLALVAAYVVFVVWLVQSKRLERWNLSLLLGIILMVRTQKGKGLIDAIARPKRFWNAIGDAGIVLTLTVMVAMTLFFLYLATLVFAPNSPVPALGPTEILVIPGVTPFVPLGYGIIALAITLIVHEGGHGVLARANAMRLKSIGLLFAIVPIGAFVEPDDLDMKVASRRQRLRVFGAGPAVNFAFAAIALTGFALMMSAVAEVPGAHVGLVVKDGPAEKAGMGAGDTVTYARTATGEYERVTSWGELRRFVNGTHPGDQVTFFLYSKAERTLTLSSQWSAIPLSLQEDVSAGTAKGQAFCKDNLTPAPTTAEECVKRFQALPRMGVQPFQDADFAPLRNPLGHGGQNLLVAFSLPAAELFGGSSVLGLYAPSFYATPFDATLYWSLANVLFWVFWINFAVALTNVLPMLPLDGGHIFRDAVGGLYARIRPGLAAERRERLVTVTATAMSFLILGAFLVQIFGPHLRNLFAV